MPVPNAGAAGARIEPARGPTIRIAVVVTAAGSSLRFGPQKKELVLLEGRSILDRSIRPFLELAGLEALVVTAPPGREGELRASIAEDSLSLLENLGHRRFAVVAGGGCRRDSVRLGLEAIADMLALAEAGAPAGLHAERLDDIVVLVHDGARPWASADLARRVAESAARDGASLPVLPLVDTPKELGPDGTVLRHHPRAALGGAQTPQGFRLGSLLSSHRRAADDGFECTDDAELWDRYIGPVQSLPGEDGNRKVTYSSDLEAAKSPGTKSLGTKAPGAKASSPASPADSLVVMRNSAMDEREHELRAAVPLRIGQGWDLHRLVSGRRLVLGGVAIPSEVGEDAHSDGDVLLHAVIDALLGAAALGDIGSHYPPSDERWRGADSTDLARRTAALLRGEGWGIGNVDCTVILERPRLGPYKEAIRAGVADCLGIESAAVSIKAKTKEEVDAVGAGLAVEAYAIASLVRDRDGGDHR